MVFEIENPRLRLTNKSDFRESNSKDEVLSGIFQDAFGPYTVELAAQDSEVELEKEYEDLVEEINQLLDSKTTTDWFLAGPYRPLRQYKVRLDVSRCMCRRGERCLACSPRNVWAFSKDDALARTLLWLYPDIRVTEAKTQQELEEHRLLNTIDTFLKSRRTFHQFILRSREWSRRKLRFSKG